jgi:hypothetical protein
MRTSRNHRNSRCQVISAENEDNEIGVFSTTKKKRENYANFAVSFVQGITHYEQNIHHS